MRQDSPAVHWPSLLASQAPSAEYSLEYVCDQLGGTKARRKSNVSLVSFRVFADVLGQASVVLGKERVLGPLDQGRETMDKLIQNGKEAPTASTDLAILAFDTLLISLGKEPVVANDEMRPRLLEQLEAEKKLLEPQDRLFAALLALWDREPDRANGLAGLRPKAGPFAAGRQFGPDAPGFVGYLSHAIQWGARKEQAEQAWKDWLAWFPRKVAAKSLDWPTLFASAVAFHSVLGSLAPGKTYEMLCEEVGAQAN